MKYIRTTHGQRLFLVRGTMVLALFCGTFLAQHHNVHAMLTTQMDFGSQSADVAELQRFFTQYSDIYPSGLITGYFGSLTQRGTERFQVSQGIVSGGTPATTGYGRVGLVTGARINHMMGNGPTGDVWSPLITRETVTVGDDTATISWTTSEQSRSRVMYGKTWPFLYSTAQSISTGEYGTTPRITLNNLDANTTYYYIRESVDTRGNITWTTNKTLRTNPN